MKTTITLLLMAAVISLSAAEANKPKSGATASKPNPPVIVGDVKAEPVAKVQNFRAGEIQLETFGVLSRPDLTGKPAWGAGVGVSYYITRGLGVGVRGISYEQGDWGGSVIDEGSARILLRAPLWDKIAPYGYVEGTHEFNDNVWGAGAGGGLEYRLTKRLGVFGETGLQITTEKKDNWLTSFGLRVSF